MAEKKSTSTKAAAKPAPTAKPAAKAVVSEKPAVKPAAKKPVAAKPAAAKPAAKKAVEVKKTEVKQTELKQGEVKPANIALKATGEIKISPKQDAKKETKPVSSAAVKPTAAPTAKPAAKTAAKPTAVKADNGKKLVLFVASEVLPFSGTGGLGEVMGSLPAAINALNGDFEARVISPLYDSFPFEERKNLEFICHINVPLAWRNQYCGLFKYVSGGTIYYFIDNEYYFKRPNLYGYYDDGERFAFLSRAVVELIPYLDKKPDVLHCQDWQTALVPIYYKLFYMYRNGFSDIKTIFTIHNIEYQGKYAKNIIEDVFGIPHNEYMSIEYKGCINLMKGAIDYADAISTVSPTYAQEIMIPFYAHGLENVLLKNSYKLRGILNGINTEVYDPATNPALFANYSVDKLSDKYKNKAELQEMLSLPVDPKKPVIALISRLVTHKGLDLVRYAMDEILKKDVQFVILGKGDPDYESYFNYIEKEYSKKVSSIITFNRDLSHKIYAAADMFLMPSKAEPCGLSQMIACRYGTVPIVRATGGLKDSIRDCGSGDDGNGFTFNNYDAGDMLHAIDRAVGLYRDYPEKWQSLVQRAMKSDFTWNLSAKEYVKFYNGMF